MIGMTGMARKGNGRIRWLRSLYWAFELTLDGPVTLQFAEVERLSDALFIQPAIVAATHILFWDESGLDQLGAQGLHLDMHGTACLKRLHEYCPLWTCLSRKAPPACGPRDPRRSWQRSLPSLQECPAHPLGHQHRCSAWCPDR